jgi:hypothetical protein
MSASLGSGASASAEDPEEGDPPLGTGVLITELGETDGIDTGGSYDGGVSYDPRNGTNDPSFDEAKRTLLANNGKLKLPHTINHIALRESFLSEAPFVVTTNRPFWRKMIDNVHFQDMLTYTYYFISSCISETTVVDTVKLASAKETSYIKEITTDLAQLYMTIPLKERDMFLPKCPEILAYLLVNAMRTAIPKHHRLMGMCQFREILLDWCTELIAGLRLTNCRLNREWFFSDAIEGPILTHPIKYRQDNGDVHGVSKRKMLINRSPLIDMFCDPMRLPRREKPRTYTVSQVPCRDLLGMQPSSSSPVLTDTSVRTRQDTMGHRQVKSLIGRTMRDHNVRMEENHKDVRDCKRENFKARQTMMSELRALDDDKRLATMRSTSALLTTKQAAAAGGDQRGTNMSACS